MHLDSRGSLGEDIVQFQPVAFDIAHGLAVDGQNDITRLQASLAKIGGLGKAVEPVVSPKP